jgi:hypothetical protein
MTAVTDPTFNIAGFQISEEEEAIIEKEPTMKESRMKESRSKEARMGSETPPEALCLCRVANSVAAMSKIEIALDIGSCSPAAGRIGYHSTASSSFPEPAVRRRACDPRPPENDARKNHPLPSESGGTPLLGEGSDSGDLACHDQFSCLLTGLRRHARSTSSRERTPIRVNYSRIGFDHTDLSNGRITVTMAKVRSTLPSGHRRRRGISTTGADPIDRGWPGYDRAGLPHRHDTTGEHCL